MNCKHPIWLASQKMFVPCGRCLSCRVSNARSWTIRLSAELSTTPGRLASFITLTYEKEPLCGSVCSRHLQLFFKRFRFSLPKSLKIKYFCSAEYGDSFGRPHYHAIVFGVNPEYWYSTAIKVFPSIPGEATRMIIHPTWTRGVMSVGYVNVKVMRYVSQYIIKKIGYACDVYDEAGIARPFMRCSKGLGLEWFEKSKDTQIKKNGAYMSFLGKKASVPRYYRKKGELTPDPVFTELDQTMIEIQRIFDKGPNVPSYLLDKIPALQERARFLYCQLEAAGDEEDRLYLLKKFSL